MPCLLQSLSISESNKSGSSDHQWARTLLNKGAIGDRVAAATILIQVTRAS